MIGASGNNLASGLGKKAVVIKVNPQKQNVAFGSLHIASGKDGGSLFKSHVVAVVQVNG